MHTTFVQADTFKGKIVNAETGEPVAGASIQSTVNPHPGWSIGEEAETDSTGCFYIDSNWEGRITFKFSMIGYRIFRKVDYSYGREVKDTTDLGTIKLQPTILMLKEVEVTAKVPRITMSGDTIVFNPEAFKLKEGARLEELIKKLPGVQRRDGKLYWNDKPIRLMMNGKNIFGGSDIIGKLPAEVAGKLKLYDRKSELARHTGSDDGTEDHVLDIQVKPGFLDKWYGDAEALYQTKKRYKFEFEASKLSDHDPQMLFLHANNIGIEREHTLENDMTSMSNSDGKNQYGSYNYEHIWQTAGAEDFDDNAFNVSANIGHVDGINKTQQSSETFFPGSDRTFAQSKTSANSHKLTPQLEASLFAYTDSANSITMDVKASYSKMRDTNETLGASYGYDPDQFEYHSLDAVMAAKTGDPLYERLIMRQSNYTSSEQEERSLNADYEWEHFLGKKGSFKLGGNTILKGADTDTHINRDIAYMREARAEKSWQYYDNKLRNLFTRLGMEFNYWLGKKVYLSASDYVTYQRRHTLRANYLDTDESLVSNGRPTTIDALNGMNDLTHSLRNQLTLKTTIIPVKPLMIIPALSWTMNHDKSQFHYGELDTTAVRTSHAVEPSLFVKWKIGRARSIDLRFAYATTVPELVSTIGYRNTIDPTYITTGNTQLRNSHSHTTTFNYHRMWLRKQIVLGLNASYTKNINPVATLFRYNSLTGVYESKPMNVKGGDTWNVGVSYDQGIGVYFRVMNEFKLAKSKSYGFLTIVDSNAPDAQPELNTQSLLGINDNIDFSYESEKVRMKLFGRLRWNRYRYDDASYNSSPVRLMYGLDATLKFDPVEFSMTLNDDYRSNYQTSSLNGHKLIAQASASYKFYKNKMRLTVSADDIFNKFRIYNYTYSAFQRTETSTDYLHHFLQVSLTYKFDAKAKK